MARIVCLANSFKKGGRCVAGIDLETGRWMRPIGRGDEGAIGDERFDSSNEEGWAAPQTFSCIYR